MKYRVGVVLKPTNARPAPHHVEMEGFHNFSRAMESFMDWCEAFQPIEKYGEFSLLEPHVQQPFPQREGDQVIMDGYRHPNTTLIESRVSGIMRTLPDGNILLLVMLCDCSGCRTRYNYLKRNYRHSTVEESHYIPPSE